MHEFFLVKDLLRKVSSIANAQRASRVTGLTVKLGVLSHISPERFREHFIHASRGTIAEGAFLHIKILSDLSEQQSQEVLLESIEVVD